MHTTLLRGIDHLWLRFGNILYEHCKNVVRNTPGNPPWLGFDLRRFVSNCRLYVVTAKHSTNKEYINIGWALRTISLKGHQAFRWWLTIKSNLKRASRFTSISKHKDVDYERAISPQTCQCKDDLPSSSTPPAPQHPRCG